MPRRDLRRGGERMRVRQPTARRVRLEGSSTEQGYEGLPRLPVLSDRLLVDNFLSNDPTFMHAEQQVMLG